MSESQDFKMVEELLGRTPQGEFSVVVRRDDGSPVVIKNHPIQFSGRPMPTMYWLVDPALVKSIGRLESTGAIDIAEEQLGLEAIAEVHNSYKQQRDSLFEQTVDGPSPSGGVGGTRVGIKCLHAHYANHLTGTDDVVGQWVEGRLVEAGESIDLSDPGIASTWESDE